MIVGGLFSLAMSLSMSLALTMLSVGGCGACSSRQEVDWQARLLLYIRNSSLEQIEGLLGEGRVDVTETAGQTGPCWLHEAISSSSVAVLELLLAAGGDLHCNRYRDGGDTLLHYAVFAFSRGDPEAVEKLSLLLEAGLDPNIPGLVGYSLLGYLLNSGLWTEATVRAVRALLDHGAFTNSSDPMFGSYRALGNSPLAFALDSSLQDEDINMELVKLLLGAGADTEERSCHTTNLGQFSCGPTPLYIASVDSYLTVVELLVDSGADIWFRYSPYSSLTPWYIWADWEYNYLGDHLPREEAKAALLEVCRERLQGEGRGEEVESKFRTIPSINALK